jgi:hypothetical protein
VAALVEKHVATSGPRKLTLGRRRHRRVLHGRRNRRDLGRLLDWDRDRWNDFDGLRVLGRIPRRLDWRCRDGSVLRCLVHQSRAAALALLAVVLALLGRAFAWRL